MIMNEDFVPYDIAVKLKEKGFEWDKITTYNPRTKVRNNHIEPTIYQVLKWLREEKKIHVATGVTPKSLWRYVIMFADERGLQEPTITVKNHSDYSSAIIAGIEYVLDNLI